MIYVKKILSSIELINLRTTLYDINENLDNNEINKIIFKSIDNKGNINNDKCIELAFARKVKKGEEEEKKER